MLWTGCYLPMQKLLKIKPRISSLATRPVKESIAVWTRFRSSASNSAALCCSKAIRESVSVWCAFERASTWRWRALKTESCAPCTNNESSIVWISASIPRPFLALTATRRVSPWFGSTPARLPEISILFRTLILMAVSGSHSVLISCGSLSSMMWRTRSAFWLLDLARLTPSCSMTSSVWRIPAVSIKIQNYSTSFYALF